jgi:hypothetical protein
LGTHAHADSKGHGHGRDNDDHKDTNVDGVTMIFGGDHGCFLLVLFVVVFV